METTIYDFIQEISSFIDIDDDMKDKAKLSGLTTTNNYTLKMLMNRWMKGIYDEDMYSLKYELEGLI